MIYIFLSFSKIYSYSRLKVTTINYIQLYLGYSYLVMLLSIAVVTFLLNVGYFNIYSRCQRNGSMIQKFDKNIKSLHHRRHNGNKVRFNKWANGGPMRDRTADLLNANQALSQLSYGPLKPYPIGLANKWWARVDSNRRPHPYQGCALTN